MAIIDLFEDQAALEEFRKDFIDDNGNPLKLINEAQLIVYEDDTAPISEDNKYNRIYTFDVNNNIPLIDYSIDPTEDTATPINSRIIHLGQRATDDNNVSKYKIRLTEHLNNLVFRDSTNTKIGLVLSSNVNTTTFSRILLSEDTAKTVPAASVLAPRGTVLYGIHGDTNGNKKMRLELYTTEPK